MPCSPACVVDPCDSDMGWACRVGDPSVSQSEVFSFRTPQPTGFNSFPQKLGRATHSLLLAKTEAVQVLSLHLRTEMRREREGILFRLALDPITPESCRLQV